MDLKIRHKGLILVCVPLVFEIFFVGILLYQLQRAERETAREARAREILALTNHLGDSMYRIAWNLASYAEKRDAASASTFQEAVRNLQVTRKRLRELVKGSPGELAKYERLDRVLSLAARYCGRIEVVMRGGLDFTQVLAMRHNLEQIVEELTGCIRDFAQESARIEKESPELQRKMRERQKLLLSGALVLNVVITILLAVFFTRNITSRLDFLTENTWRLGEEKELLPILSGGDEIAHLDKVFHHMAAALREAAQKERAMLKHARDVICSLDGDLNFTRVNPASWQVWGYREDEILGRSLLALLNTSEHRDSTREAMQSIRNQDPDVSFETQLLRSDSSIVDLLWSAHWAESDGSYFCVAHDITDRKQVERLKQDFYSMVTHDLRTPLTSVKGMIGLMSAGAFGELEPKLKEKISVVQRNIERLITLINDLLDLEKMESGKMPLERSQRTARSILERAVQSVEAYAQQNRIKLEIDADDVTLEADGDRLIQVLVNFLSNAIKFSPAESTVTLTTTAEVGFVEFSCIDRGRGIPEEFRGAIFERFQQVQASDARRNVGTGLGLAICKLIVEAHGGDIGVESEVDRGSRFWFRIPA